VNVHVCESRHEEPARPVDPFRVCRDRDVAAEAQRGDAPIFHDHCLVDEQDL
jgi:hypothetical protein